MYRHSLDIPIGPQHPALKEPANFILSLSGERVTGVNIRLGYNHRGIEKACEERTYIQDLYLLERICGICSHSHSTCFALAVEELAALEIPKRATYIRMLVCELERIHSHLLWLGVAGHEIGFDTLLMYTWRDRELALDILAKITGNRVNYGINTIGGVRRDLTPELVDDTLKAVDALEERTNYYIRISTTESTMIQRLSGVGTLSREAALQHGAVGPTLRASGAALDVRKDDPYLAYDELDFNVCTHDTGDVFGRAVVRLKELMESYKMIRQILANLPDGPIAVKAPRKIPAGEAFSRYEAPRGEDVHYVRANGTDKPDRVKVRAPSLANLQAVPAMLDEHQLADVPIVIAAIDPCFSCTDRTIAITDPQSLRDGVMTWDELRRIGIEHYRRKGIDCSTIRLR